MAKRNKLEIMKDIMEIIAGHKNSIKPTPLLRQSNMSSTRFKDYFEEMVGKGFVREVNEGDGKRIVLTNKGYKFLEKYKTIISFIDEFEL